MSSATDTHTFLKRWLTLPTPVFVVVTGTFTFVVQVTFSLLLINLFGADDYVEGLEELPVSTLILAVVVLAPLIETVLAQTIPINLVRRFTHDPLTPIVVASLVFSLMHIANGPWYCLYTLPTAIVYAVAYYFRLLHRGHAYTTIASVHAVQNGWAVVLMLQA